jgi:hypothetical protein
MQPRLGRGWILVSHGPVRIVVDGDTIRHAARGNLGPGHSIAATVPPPFNNAEAAAISPALPPSQVLGVLLGRSLVRVPAARYPMSSSMRSVPRCR